MAGHCGPVNGSRPGTGEVVMKTQVYEVIIVGGGISGTSLMYTLARYSDVPSTR